MAPVRSLDPRGAIGRSPDSLSLEERFAFAGCYVALEVYTPEAIPLRRIEAIAGTVEECIQALQARGLNAAHYEYVRLTPPY